MISHKKKLVYLMLISLLMLVITNSAVAEPQIDINAPSAILMDAGTGTILFEKNAHEKMEPASITKIMTLIIALESVESGKVNLSDIVRVSERAWKTGGSQVFLGPGEEQTLETLLKCIVISSANDASMAVAEYIGGSVEGFVKLMNDKAKELGMKNTHFTNPHGLSDPDHYTTAYDIALMSRELVKYPIFFKWSTIWMDYLEHTDKKREATMLANTNKLLGKYEGLDGLKTGFHNKAGHCFAGTAKRGDFRLISVVLNAQNSNQRFEDTVKLLDYGFGHYDSIKVVEKGMVQKTIPVEKGHINEVNVIVPEDVSILIEKGKQDQINTKIDIPEKLSAPLSKNQEVGTLTVEQNGKTVKQINLVVSEDVKKAGFIELLKRIFSKWLN
ncbi:MAG TPA: D-alanyl-D-alanine carboxypeptidase [Thermoanaerobacterales bacterium]|uniref:D-alanyl-D-alanine carboxypeptidase family protein n=1 Tax=Tepidanaerobacter sp. GT38 TaxID=2722793 RepID=UPI00179D4FBF|nr:D-alanyl-D-alanine carboxypeptidase family protein [Tepidanaerobacter sp. GT38]MCG1012665.1 D-alanyl-D-alanine carboxypeptidase [Tepidanaerobacter sp. GT38]HHY41400.1 D-alanyl-D-alanine carboxypeptidase [Thermoanaerobacterales bacterium]